MKQLLILILFFLTTQPILFAKDYNILDFGAKPDGKTLNTAAIQSAVDQAAKDGGGRVVIPKGRFLSGSVILKSGVELHLEKKAVLLGSTNHEDYIKLNRWKALVMADKAENIAITGKGTLDGQGAELALKMDSLFYAGEIDSSVYVFPEMRPLADIRPQVIEFVRCKHAKVTDVTVKDGASWVQTYVLCEDLLIDHIRVESDAYWNNDGMDIIDCRNTRITNCYVNSADDGICLKSYANLRDGTEFCDSIYIGNCTVRSSASAIKFGTATYGGFKNITVENIKVFDTFRSAIALESVSLGILENVLIQNVKAVNTGNAIFIRLEQRKSFLSPGVLRNVTIRDVKVKVCFDRPDSKYEIRGPELPFFHNVFPSSISGIPDYPVEEVTLENIKIIYPGRGNKAYANMPLDRIETIPENIADYPEFSMFGELPAWGFYVRHVEGLTMKNVQVKIKSPDYRPAMVFDEVSDLTLEAIEVKGDDKAEPFYFNRVTGKKIVE